MWSIIEKFSVQSVQFVIGILLARMLGPSIFGLVALTGIFTALAKAITDAGFEKVLIKQQRLSDLQINTAFYLTLGIAFVLYGGLFICAPYIGLFFNEPELIPIIRILGLSVILDAFGQTQVALALKELQFKKVTIAQIASAVVSGAVGLSLAINGWGVWSLVYSSLASTAVWVSFFWIKSSWYPSMQFSYNSISGQIRFGMYVLGNSLVYFGMQQYSTLIVGRIYGKTDVGLFARGMKFPELISSVVQSAVIKVSFPLFSKMHGQGIDSKNYVSIMVKGIGYVSLPLFGFLFINAEDIVIFLLTEEWLGCVYFVKLFCLVKMLEPFIAFHKEYLLSRGLSKKIFLSLILFSLFEVGLMLLLVRYGIENAILSILLNRILQAVYFSSSTSNKIGISVWNQIKALLPIVGGVILFLITSELVTSLFRPIHHQLLWVALAASFLSASFVYVLYSRWVVNDLLNTLFSFIRISSKKLRAA